MLNCIIIHLRSVFYEYLAIYCSSFLIHLSKRNRNENSLASDRVWTLADALPGEPDRDYPIFATAPETGFSCDDKRYGKDLFILS